MNSLSMMQHALGEQWEQLPPALKAHYCAEDNTDTGNLSIEFPAWMSAYLHLLHRFGALIPRRGHALPTTVEKRLREGSYRWTRTTRFPDDREIQFHSRWQHADGNELVEFINRFLGLRMAVHVAGERLYFEGRHIILRLGRWQLPIPESLALGHTTIVESALDNEHFEMDIRLTHPLFGQVYRYSGIFRVSRPLPADG